MNRKRLPIIIVIVVVVVVAVLLDTMLANHRPAIESLAAREEVVPNGTCEIVCIASDRDGDALSYNWSASGGSISGTGASVNWTSPAQVGSYNVTVNVTDGRGGEATDYRTIEVRINRAPSISSLAGDADWTLPSGALQVTCTASDPDGDELTYEWTASGGNVSGRGAAVNWTAPQQIGIYNVTVVVKDSHGSSDTITLAVSVAPEQPPTIEMLKITKDRYGHCYLKSYSGGYYVGMEQMYDIECTVSDTGIELSYDWSRTGGDISMVFEDGSMIAWIAPDTSGKVTVTVIVSDVAGNMATKSLALTVASCSACTFGACAG